MKRNKSSVFILPMVTGIPYKYFTEFINCYIACNHDDSENDRRIYIAFESKDLIDENEKVLKDSELFVRELIVGDYTLLIFKPNECFNDDFDKFKDGRYSKFSNKYKKLLRTLYPSITKLKSIIEPSEKDRESLAKELSCSIELINSEIYDVPDDIEESFTMAHFLNVDL